MTNQLILDAAFKVAINACSPSTHAEAKDRLQSMFPDVEWSEIVDAYLKGSELAEKCYEIGDTARREKQPDNQTLEILKHRFPGFSDNVYNEALTRGWFLSR